MGRFHIVFLTGLSGSLLTSPLRAESEAGSGSHSLGLRIDCVHNFNLDKGAAQNCLAISGLRLNLNHKVSEEVRAFLRIDPYGTPDISRAATPLRTSIPGNKDGGSEFLDDYSLTWVPRPHLEVSVEGYEGAAMIPNTSGLAFAASLQNLGWRQTAVTVTYNLAAFSDMRVKFAAGNGEGENGSNMDPQQYFAFETDAAIVQGIRAHIGVSMDGNNVGSSEYQYVIKNLEKSCDYDRTRYSAEEGYSTQRIGAGLMLDGTFPHAKGLKIGLGWQRSVLSDLDKKKRAMPGESDLEKCPQYDTDYLFVENETGESVNTVQKTVIGFNFQYEITQGYFLGFDYSSRSTDTGSASVFEVCDGYKGTVCTAPSGNKLNKLSETAVSFGGGVELGKDLLLSLEYLKSSYDQAYVRSFYLAPNDKTSDTFEAFNARLAYNWQ